MIEAEEWDRSPDALLLLVLLNERTTWWESRPFIAGRPRPARFDVLLPELNRGTAITWASARVGTAPADAYPEHPWHAAFQSAYFEYLKPRADLLRCLLANPFRPVIFSPQWRTSTAVAIAAQMHESRDFDAMPILADALQDAGCDSADVLDHCRGPGPHVRGCWVVDLVLGKE